MIEVTTSSSAYGNNTVLTIKPRFNSEGHLTTIPGSVWLRQVNHARS